MRRFVLAAAVAVAMLAAVPAQAATDRERKPDKAFDVRVLSSPADMVTGGDALVEVSIPKNVSPKKVTVSVNGIDITDTLTYDEDAETLTGMVTNLELGDNELHVDSNGREIDLDGLALAVDHDVLDRCRASCRDLFRGRRQLHCG